MAKLVHIKDIFSFTEDEINQIKNCGVEEGRKPLEELWMSYSELTDKDRDIYTKDDCNTDLAFVSFIGNPYLWDWMFLERGFRIKMKLYGFSDNASQVIHYAEEKLKDFDGDYCIALVPFEPTNHMDEKFCYGNGDYIGRLKNENPGETTLWGLEIPEDMHFMFQFYILVQEIPKRIKK